MVAVRCSTNMVAIAVIKVGSSAAASERIVLGVGADWLKLHPSRYLSLSIAVRLRRFKYAHLLIRVRWTRLQSDQNDSLDGSIGIELVLLPNQADSRPIPSTIPSSTFSPPIPLDPEFVFIRWMSAMGLVENIHDNNITHEPLEWCKLARVSVTYHFFFHNSL